MSYSGPGEFSSVAKGHTAIAMLSAQPVAAGLLEPTAVHRPVHAYDKITLEDSGLVSRDSPFRVSTE